jgi:hypothetical protein
VQQGVYIHPSLGLKKEPRLGALLYSTKIKERLSLFFYAPMCSELKINSIVLQFFFLIIVEKVILVLDWFLGCLITCICHSVYKHVGCNQN